MSVTFGAPTKTLGIVTAVALAITGQICVDNYLMVKTWPAMVKILP